MSLFPDLTNSPQGRNWGFHLVNTNFGLPLLDLKTGIRLEADLFNSNPPLTPESAGLCRYILRRLRIF